MARLQNTPTRTNPRRGNACQPLSYSKIPRIACRLSRQGIILNHRHVKDSALSVVEDSCPSQGRIWSGNCGSPLLDCLAIALLCHLLTAPSMSCDSPAFWAIRGLGCIGAGTLLHQRCSLWTFYDYLSYMSWSFHRIDFPPFSVAGSVALSLIAFTWLHKTRVTQCQYH